MRTTLVLAAFVLSGCGENYELRIEMKPEGGAFARSIRREDSKSLPMEVRSIVAAAYDETDGKSAADVFEEELPGELGGTGFHHRYVSDLGSAWIYSELVQESRSPWEFVQQVGTAADRCADLYLGWMRWQLADVERAQELFTGIDAPLRLALKDMTLRIALGGDLGSEWSGLFQALHHLLIGEVASLGDVPDLWRRGNEDDFPASWVLSLLRPEFAQELELDPDGEELAFLENQETLTASWQAWLEAGGGQDVTEPPEKDSHPGEPLEPLADLFLLPNFLFGGNQSLSLELATTHEPLATNGTFEAASGVVRWADRRLREDRVLPLYCYATWAAPDEEAQRARFGSVVLSGQELFEYTLWYAGLHEDEVAWWKRALGDADVEHGLLERLEELDVEPEEPTAAEASALDEGAELLLRVLRPN